MLKVAVKQIILDCILQVLHNLLSLCNEERANSNPGLD